MSTNGSSAVDVSFLEKCSEVLSGFSDRFGAMLTGLFGSSNERYVRRLGYIRTRDAQRNYTITPGSLLARINSHEDAIDRKSVV